MWSCCCCRLLRQLVTSGRFAARGCLAPVRGWKGPGGLRVMPIDCSKWPHQPEWKTALKYADSQASPIEVVCQPSQCTPKTTPGLRGEPACKCGVVVVHVRDPQRGLGWRKNFVAEKERIFSRRFVQGMRLSSGSGQSGIGLSVVKVADGCGMGGRRGWWMPRASRGAVYPIFQLLLAARSVPRSPFLEHGSP